MCLSVVLILSLIAPPLSAQTPSMSSKLITGEINTEDTKPRTGVKETSPTYMSYMSYMSSAHMSPTTTLPILETTTVAALQKTKEPVTQTTDPAPLQTTEGVSTPLTLIQTSQPRSMLIQTTPAPETFTSYRLISTPHTAVRTEGSTTEDVSEPGSTIADSTTDSTIITSTAFTHTITQVTSTQTPTTAHSQPPSDSIPFVKSNKTHPKAIDEPKAHWLGVVVIALLVGLVCAGGAVIAFLVKNHKKRKTEVIYKNGGSKKFKRKKGPEEDAWAGPVALNGEQPWGEEGEDERKMEEGKKEQEGNEMVLSTFIATETEHAKEETAGVAESSGAEVPLLLIDEQQKDELAPPVPLDSSDVNVEAEKKESQAFCLTSAV